MDATTTAALEKALELLRAGRKEDANDILLPMVQKDPENANAWYLLGFTLTDTDKRLYCYRQVFRIDPTNRAAQKQIALLTNPPQQQPPTPQTGSLPVKPTPGPKPAATPTRKQKPKARRDIQSMLLPIGILLAVLALFALIGWGVIYYNDGKKTNEQVNTLFIEKKCDEVVKFDTFEKSFPRDLFSSTFSVYHQVDECHAYLSFKQALNVEDWSTAYTIIENYFKQHPQGLFTSEMNQQAGNILFSWSKNLMAKKDFRIAIAKVDLAQKQFGTTPAGQNAIKTMFDDYLIWAKDAYEKSDYEEAERILKIVGWDQKSSPEQVKQADNALVVVYIAWGNAQIKAEEYQKGLLYYARAKELDPTGADYDRLINKATLAQTEKQLKINNFDSALESIDRLLATPLSDESKADVLAQQSKILHAYAYSNTTQAEKQIAAAAISICNDQLPALPIFALDSEKIRVRIGAAFYFDLKNDDWVAKTPAELHYVVCIKQVQQTIQTCDYYFGYTVRRFRLDWKVSLYNTTTATAYKTTSMTGSTPRYCPNDADSLVYSKTDIFGTQPKIQTVIDWLAQLKLIQ